MCGMTLLLSLDLRESVWSPSGYPLSISVIPDLSDDDVVQGDLKPAIFRSEVNGHARDAPGAGLRIGDRAREIVLPERLDGAGKSGKNIHAQSISGNDQKSIPFSMQIVAPLSAS